MASNAAAVSHKQPKVHSVASIVLLVLAGIVSLLAAVSIWANRQLLNPDRWAHTSTQLLQRKAVRQATANYLVEQLYQNVNVQNEVGQALKALDGSLGVSSTAKNVPGSSLLPATSLDALSGPIAGALRGLAKQGIDEALQTAIFQDLWQQANKVADQSLVAVVEGKKGPVGLEQGVVSIDLGQVLTNVTKQIGLGSTISLPPGTGNVVLMRSDQIKSVQDGGRILRTLPWILVPLGVILYGLAVLLAVKGRRRRMVMGVGLSLAVAGFAVLVIRSLLVSQIPAQLASDASIQPAARDVVDVATSLLATVANATWQLGLLVIIGAWFAGPSSFTVPIRRAFAPLVRRESWFPFAVVFVLLMLLFLWAPIEVLRAPLCMLLLLIGGLAGAEILRRQMLVEFPEVAGAEGHEWFDDAGARVGEWVRSVRIPKISISRGDGGQGAAASKVAPAESTVAKDEAPTVEQRADDEAPTVQKPADDEAPTVEQHADDEAPTVEQRAADADDRDQ